MTRRVRHLSAVVEDFPARDDDNPFIRFGVVSKLSGSQTLGNALSAYPTAVSIHKYPKHRAILNATVRAPSTTHDRVAIFTLYGTIRRVPPYTGAIVVVAVRFALNLTRPRVGSNVHVNSAKIPAAVRQRLRQVAKVLDDDVCTIPAERPQFRLRPGIVLSKNQWQRIIFASSFAYRFCHPPTLRSDRWYYSTGRVGSNRVLM